MAHDSHFDKKADRIMAFMLEVGNFERNQRWDFSGMSYMKRKFVLFWGRLSDMLRHFWVFPPDLIRLFGGVLRSGLLRGGERRMILNVESSRVQSVVSVCRV